MDLFGDPEPAQTIFDSIDAEAEVATLLQSDLTTQPGPAASLLEAALLDSPQQQQEWHQQQQQQQETRAALVSETSALFYFFVCLIVRGQEEFSSWADSL